jgi:hypothetical protein
MRSIKETSPSFVPLIFHEDCQKKNKVAKAVQFAFYYLENSQFEKYWSNLDVCKLGTK